MNTPERMSDTKLPQRWARLTDEFRLRLGVAREGAESVISNLGTKASNLLRRTGVPIDSIVHTARRVSDDVRLRALMLAERVRGEAPTPS